MSLPDRLFRCMLLAGCLLFSGKGYCLLHNTSLPVNIVADSTSFNYRTGVSTYEGNVQVTQGSTRLEADRVKTWNNAQHRIREAVAFGFHQPAHYITFPKSTEPPLRAIAKVIRFYPFRSLVFLEGNARVEQGSNIFTGPVAIYDIKNQTVTAPRSRSGGTYKLVQAQASS